jgi:hypothetical protein
LGRREEEGRKEIRKEINVLITVVMFLVLPVDEMLFFSGY